MRRPKSKGHYARQQRWLSEAQEIELLEEWIEAMKPDSGTNPLAFIPPPPDAPVGRLKDGGFSPYAGAEFFRQLPISQKTKDGLAPKYTKMSEIQRATLPHSLCGRDVLGAAKTGSGKTLAFIITVIEKLYRARWGPQDGVGSIIISPTRELAAQLFDELKLVGKYHSLSAGLLIGGRKNVDAEKERVNGLNILVCTPGRLLQHMNESPNFECSQLQIMVLDEADQTLDESFHQTLKAIVSQIPKKRQTLLFSATLTKEVKDRAGLRLEDPEYINVHAESTTATPKRLTQFAIFVPLDEKLSMLWRFIKGNLRSKIIVFMKTCKQVKFVYEAFRKLRPGISLKCLHGKMSQLKRSVTCLQFQEETSVLFTTDYGSNGLDFKAVDWVILFDCPENITTYIMRVGRTARFGNSGKSLLFLIPSEKEMLKKLQAHEPKIPIQLKKAKVPESISPKLSSLLAKYPSMHQLAQKAFSKYVQAVFKKPNKEVFNVFKLPIEDFAVSLGLCVTPKLGFVKRNSSALIVPPKASHQEESVSKDKSKFMIRSKHFVSKSNEVEDDILLPKEASSLDMEGVKTADLASRILKKKQLRINIHKPSGTRVKFDEDGMVIPPLASISKMESGDSALLLETVKERYKKLREEMKLQDKEDKFLCRQRLRDRRTKEKMKLKRCRVDNEETGTLDPVSLELDKNAERNSKRSKIYFDDADDDEIDGMKAKEDGTSPDSISIEQQEALALKLLHSLHG